MDATIIRRQIIYFNVNAFIPATVFSISHIFSWLSLVSAMDSEY